MNKCVVVFGEKLYTSFIIQFNIVVYDVFDLLGSSKSSFDDIPVDNIPNSLDVVGSDIPVIDVVG
jgi:hypothetical protein